VHNVRESNEGNKVVALFLVHFILQIFFHAVLWVFIYQCFFGTIGENIKIIGEDGISLYINALKLCQPVLLC